MTVLYKADPVRGAQWAALFAQRAPDLPFRVWPDIGDPALIRYRLLNRRANGSRCRSCLQARAAWACEDWECPASPC